MDTKSKKWKVVVSFAAFFLCVNLLLASLGTAFLCLTGNWYSVDYLKDAFREDYQATGRFRNQISCVLENFLTMAAGGPLNGYSSGYADSSVIYSGTTWNWSSISMEAGSGWDWEEWERQVQEYEERLKDPYLSDSEREELKSLINAGPYGDGTKPKTNEELRAEYQKQADKAHETYKADRNILYAVAYDGKLKYTNADGASVTDGIIKMDLPKGYNFLLYFDGEKVTITKDGQVLDVYGDGIYRDNGSQWYVPGYQNFTVDADTKKARVTIAVAQEPLLYLLGNFSGKSNTDQYSRLYWLVQNFQSAREAVCRSLVVLAAGLALLVVWLLLRKDKRQADRSIAHVTGRLPFELKLLLVLGVVGLCVGSFCYQFRELLYWGFRSEVNTVAEIANQLAWGGNLASGVMTWAFYPAFWLCWLGVNDLRFNKKPWKHGLVSRLLARDFRRPVQKRLVRWCYGAMAAVVVLTLLALAVFFCVAPRSAGLLFWLMVPVMAVVFLLFALIANRNYAAARDLGRLSDQIEAVRNGGLTEPLVLPEDSDLRQTADSLNDIQRGMHAAMEEQIKSQRMKVELLTNVSHDIKTPLTSILSYAELLLEEEGLPEHVRDYAKILVEKAQRLKTMVQDVFEVSKATSGDLPVTLETLDLGKLLRQTLADMGERIDESPVTVKADIPESPLFIRADGQRLYRVFQNLLQNALCYSLEGSRVYVTLHSDGRMAVASVKNTSRSEIPLGKDFTERFVRGDESRTDGGSGLGLSIANSFTEACGGRFSVENNADLFVVTVEFPLLEA